MSHLKDQNSLVQSSVSKIFLSPQKIPHKWGKIRK